MSSRWHEIAPLPDIAVGERKIVSIHGKSIGVFNVNGSFVAVLNVCPHELAPVCAGAVIGTTAASSPGEYPYEREGQILRCPWHGWEFDLLTGQCLVDKRRLKTFPVRVEKERIYVQV